MKKANEAGAPFGRRQWRLLWLTGSVVAGVLAACGGSPGTSVSPAPPRLAATAVKSGPQAPTLPGTTYTVVNLDAADSSGSPFINSNNQVAFTAARNLVGHAGFFDGDRVREIGSFRGAESSAAALNDAGQVVGVATNAAGASVGFRWTQAGGMVSLGTLGAAVLYPRAINRLGQVAGTANTTGRNRIPRAFFWSDAGGARDLGTLGGAGGSFGQAINDAGTVVGTSLAADGVNHGVAWYADGVMIDLGLYGGLYSSVNLVNNAGQVGGVLQLAGTGGLGIHGFVWSKAGGMRDVGTLGGDYSYLAAMNDAGQVTGVSRPDCAGCLHAITWSAAEGLTDLGTLGGANSGAAGINRHGEVVGWSESDSASSNNFHAFVWIKGQGMVDLNQRIPNAPAGLNLTTALAISDSGAIVADSNIGLVLLLPGDKGTDAPLVGPITPDGVVRVHKPIPFAVTFSDRNSGDRHSATWYWNDGCGLDAVSKVQGPGTLRANHTFCREGEFWVTVKVTDSTGRSTTVGRTVMAYGE